MRKNTFPSRKEFKNLILSCADGSGYGVDLENASEQEKAKFLKETILSELGWMLDKNTPFTMAKHWLTGLASACTIPFYNGHIIEWLQLKGFIVTPHNEEKSIDQYWNNAAFALVALIK